MRNLTQATSLAGRSASAIGGCKIIVIGASLGGMHALRVLLGSLPEAFFVPLVIVQHRGFQSDDTLLRYLQKWSRLPVFEPNDKDLILGGRVYIAPAGYHLLIEHGQLVLSTEAPVCHARPSVDVLFQSAADTHGTGCIGVLLTGAGQDGVRGLASIKAAGGMTVVQDPALAECPSMPQAAIANGVADHILALSEIAPFLIMHCDILERQQNAG